MKCVQFSRDEHFFARPKHSKTSRKKCAKRAQIGAKKCKRAQIQKTLPLNRKQLLTHFCLYLSEHSDTICREKCETTARKNLWRADFSKTSTFSFTSVNLHFRAETQRHVNLRYFGGPRKDQDRSQRTRRTLLVNKCEEPACKQIAGYWCAARRET